MKKYITLTGAREHNLKNITVSIPRNAFTVITGLSGSGKSSLAFDTIYAEGQRRYVESLSPYARQFLEKMKKPDVDRISGLSPSISIDQKHTSKNPRSTVGTVTEVYDYLRLLYAKAGDVTCYQCGNTVSAVNVDEIIAQLRALTTVERLHISAPLVAERKGEFKDVFEQIKKQGFSKVCVDGTVYDLADEIKLKKTRKHTIDVLVDRLLNDDESEEQMRASLSAALRVGNGVCVVEAFSAKGKVPKRITFSETLFCHTCQIGFADFTPNMFSFNSTLGACPTCKGLGKVPRLMEGLVIIDEHKPLLKGAVNKEIFFSFNKYFIEELVHSLHEYYHFDLATPFCELRDEVKEAFFWGNQECDGVLDELRALLHRTESVNIKQKIRTFLKEEECVTCGGGRLARKSLGVKINGKNIVEVSELSLVAFEQFMKQLSFSKTRVIVAEPIMHEIMVRLKCLLDMGLGYLTLNRSSATLAGGEMQRMRLASQIGTGLTGVLYVLDEPSIGLHARDNDKLLALIRSLKELNNTILVVEHDEETMRQADYIVDLGPGAGHAGGEVMFAASADTVNSAKEKRSLTLDYLQGRKRIAVPAKRKSSDAEHMIRMCGVSEHNLKNITVHIPLGLLVCVTGVSGSGKSTLVHDILYKALHNMLWKTDYAVGKYMTLEGCEHIDKVVAIDQSPIGRTPRSNPATYVDVFGHIRQLFSALPDAKVHGFKAGHFSFNVKGGRCDVCEGAGVQRIEMSFLPDVSVVCDACGGKRYKPEILEVTYKGKSIADVLAMQISEACVFFDTIPQIRERLTVLDAVGLGYVQLGQSSTTLSGGEAQRIKIAYELSKRQTGKTLYILDEPTTGLHFADIDNLLTALFKLRDAGNSVIIIEHNLDVIKTADHVIDLGPEGGDGGGRVVVAGTPEIVARSKRSHTGAYLKPYLK